MKTKLVGGPRCGQLVDVLPALHAELRFEAERELPSMMQRISIGSTSVHVAEHRYIRHEFIVRGCSVFAYVWEHMHPVESAVPYVLRFTEELKHDSARADVADRVQHC